jgi:hypothetical protein
VRAIAPVVKLSGVRSSCEIWKRDVHGYVRYKFVVVVYSVGGEKVDGSCAKNTCFVKTSK